MKRLAMWFVLIVCSFSVALFGCTQNGAIQEDVEKLKEGQANIIKELEEVKTLLKAKAPSARGSEFKEALVDVGNDPFEGDKLAKVTLIEFYDFQ